jgi:hypothetical protein
MTKEELRAYLSAQTKIADDHAKQIRAALVSVVSYIDSVRDGLKKHSAAYLTLRATECPGLPPVTGYDQTLEGLGNMRVCVLGSIAHYDDALAGIEKMRTMALESAEAILAAQGEARNAFIEDFARRATGPKN